jgi:hypothetical protein
LLLFLPAIFREDVEAADAIGRLGRHMGR